MAADGATPWWDQPVATALPKGGKTLAKATGAETVNQLLRLVPRKYLDLGQITDLSQLPMGQPATVHVEVVAVNIRDMRSRRGSIVEATLTDHRSTLKTVFFAKNRGHAGTIAGTLPVGESVLLTGVLDTYRDERQLKQPSVASADADELQWRKEHPIKPIYSATAKVTSDAIEQALRVVLAMYPVEELPDPCAAVVDTGADRPVMPLAAAIRKIHHPRTWADQAAGRKRLAFEEAFVTQTVLMQRRAQQAQRQAAAFPATDGKALAVFDQGLPFELTGSQRRVGEELAGELANTQPMMRLLQGDVGSGKTIVALRAMLQVVDAGGQCALLAPTEVLATQHFRSITAMLGPLGAKDLLGGHEHGVAVRLVTGSMGQAAKRQTLADIASGTAGIVVGTHALLYQTVQFAQLGFVVVDEQHRFGVDQRDALRAKARSTPHTLVMTATPIPRTVAMTVFGDLDVSQLTELPPRRATVTTHVVPETNQIWLDRVWQRVAEEVAKGRQAFVVCSRITEDDDAGATTSDAEAAPHGVHELADELQQMPVMQGVKIGVLHGQMPADAKDGMMQQFSSGVIDVLVSTTVVEVGVDVPNATLMVIMDADRFGIAQLHQLRGRIGRGEHGGVCLLVTAQPDTDDSAHRLAGVAATTDGFELAELDTDTRREGNVLGAEQSGSRSSLRALRVMKDADLIGQAREAAVQVLAQDPTLAHHPVLLQACREALGDEEAEYLGRT